MIKIQNLGTRAVFIAGRPQSRRYVGHGRPGNKGQVFTFPFCRLSVQWRNDCIDSEILFNEDSYVTSLSFFLHYRTRTSSREMELWTENYDDKNTKHSNSDAPGSYSRGRNRSGAWALWLSETPGGEGVLFGQTPTSAPVVHFHCTRGSKTIEIRWNLHCTVSGTLKLPSILIKWGYRDKVIESWRRLWIKSSRRILSSDKSVGWCGGPEIGGPKDLEDIVSILKNRRSGVNWFALGPSYASSSGDWLLPAEPFKKKMGQMSRVIQDGGMIPGLRLAPFLVSRRSRTAQTKRHWLVRGPGAAPLTVSGYPNKNDAAYVLDISIPEVIKALRRIFYIMHNQWGYRVFMIDRISDVAVPGQRSNDHDPSDVLISNASTLIRETLGKQVFLVASDVPLLSVPEVWDARSVAPTLLPRQRNFVSNRLKKAMTTNTSAALFCSPWQGRAWLNHVGVLEFPEPPVGEEVWESLREAVVLGSGLLLLTGDPRDLNDQMWEEFYKFRKRFGICRKGRLSLSFPEPREDKILVARNSQGWVGLFNLTGKKKIICLDQKFLQQNLGGPGSLSVARGTVFNSPEIHITLPPQGCRIFKT